MSSLQSIMNLDDDQQDAASPMDKKDKDVATPASGFRTQNPSSSTPSTGRIPRPGQPSSSTLSPPTIRIPTAEGSDNIYPSQHTVDADPRPGSAVQQGKRPAEPTSATLTVSAVSSRPGDSRRQSSTSVDSMDQHGYASSSSMGGGAGGGGYPPNQPRRPMGSPGPEVPIRLTPITGRVSRAKKGVPVHVCERCNPPKTFTRAEHLRRHQLSHQQPQYECDKCDRAFHRLDLLTRHQQRHNEGDKGSPSGGISRRGSKDSVTSGTLEDRMPGLRVGSLQPPVGYPSSSQGFGGASTPSSMSDMPPGTPPTGSRPGSTMSPPPAGNGDSYGPSAGHQASNAYSNYTLQSNMPIIHQPESMDSSPEPVTFSNVDYMAPRTTPLPLFVSTSGLSSSVLQTALDNPPELIHTTDYSPWTSASESTYSTPSEMPSRRRYLRHAHQNSFEWQNPNLLSAFSTGARREISTSGSLEAMATPYYVPTSFPLSPQLAPHLGAPHHSSYDTLIHEPMITDFDDQSQSLMDPANATQHAMHQRSSSVRSPPPPTSTSASGQVADTLVTPAPLHPRVDPMAHTRQKALAVGDGSGDVGMGIMGADGDSPHWHGDNTGGAGIRMGPELSGLGGCGIGGGTALATPLSRAVRNAIPSYLKVYWERFHPSCPVVHRRTFEMGPEEVLRCAMAAMATQFLNGKEDRIRGSQLHEYAWQEAKRLPQWSLQVMQAILLCEQFARFRGRKAVVRPSKHFENLYSRVLDHNPNLYDTALPSDAAGFGSHQNMGLDTDNEQRWRIWLEAEARRRLLAGCFILDNHAAVFHQQPRARDDVDPSIVPLTTYSDALWAANSANEWAAILDANPATGRPQCVPRLDTLRPEEVVRYTPFDQASILNAAALNLPCRHNPRSSTGGGGENHDHISSEDLRTPTNASYAQTLKGAAKPDDQLAHLFSHCAPGAADVYVALHHTPLYDLLAVSGDSWVLCQKVLGAPAFLENQKRLKAWAEGRPAAASSPASPTTADLESMSAAKAAVFAARALAGYLDRGGAGAVSDYWGMYVCALVVWAFGHRAAAAGAGRSSGGSGDSPTRKAVGEGEALNWLRAVAGHAGQPELASRVRGRREASAAVVSMVRRRLEADCAGGRSRLYVDAVGVLRKLEEGVNRRWF